MAPDSTAARFLEDDVVNFGGNLRFLPEVRYAPNSEAEVLEILKRHAGRRIRAVGRLHSWSAAPECQEVLIDLRSLNNVEVRRENGRHLVEVGAGCQIKRLLSELSRQGEFTLPSLGLIAEQTIAGATGTGTHGSGRHSLSHYLQSARIACYDPDSGEPVIRVVDSGDELRAARCHLGCLGIVTSVTLPVRPQYQIEEHFRRYAAIEDVLDAEASYDLQQFYLVPWRWDFFAQHRREVDRPRSRLAPLYRVYWSLGMDVAFHLAVCALARYLPWGCTRLFYRRIMPPLVPRGWRVVDRSDRQLTMGHDKFRHIEIEIFVARRRLPETIDYVVWLLQHLGGNAPPLKERTRQCLMDNGFWEELRSAGSYLHHYPICIRKLLPDETLISMAAGEEDSYAISFISYLRPDQREAFFRFAEILAKTTAALFAARPHWGKVFPLQPNAVASLYPRFDAFREVVQKFDSAGSFRNRWTDELFSSAVGDVKRTVGSRIAAK